MGLGLEKPSPKGEGWVRGNLHDKKLHLNPLYPNLLPQGEGVKSTALQISVIRRQETK